MRGGAHALRSCRRRAPRRRRRPRGSGRWRRCSVRFSSQPPGVRTTLDGVCPGEKQMPGEFSDQDSAHGESGPAIAPAVALTDTQHRILEALCRPASGGSRFSTPATNQEIAAEVFLSVDAVKAHLRTLYRKFGIEDLPHNQKRARLVELVVE